jgi:hypothetical protein
MFNSPLEYCPRCRQYVALDLTQRECAVEHQCGKEPCPLESHFMERVPDDEGSVEAPLHGCPED